MNYNNQNQNHNPNDASASNSSSSFPNFLNTRSTSSGSQPQNGLYTYTNQNFSMATANKGPLVDLKPDISSYSHGQDGMSSTESEGVAGPSSGRRKKPSMTKRTSSSHHHHDHHDDTGAESDDGHHHGDEPRKKRSKRSTGKACVYCRRSHMVCEGGRPCERCIKREIPHLCRDFTPPPHHPHHSDHKHERTRTTSPHLEELPAIQEPLPPQPQPVLSSNQPPQLPPQQLPPIYSDPNFPPTWPLLPDSNGQITFSSAPMEQQLSNPGTSTVPAPSWHNDDSELAALNKFMKDLGVPNLPTDFLAFMNQLEGQDPNGLAVTSLVDDLTTGSITPTDSNGVFPTPPQGPSSATKQFVAPPPSLKGKGRDASGSKLSHMSRMDKYLMAAADQPNGPRASRLAQVIKAKYDAGLLKPYDYVKGYERMNKWMESGRAAPKMDSRQVSPINSPSRGPIGRNGRLSFSVSTPVAAFGKSISPDSRRRILAALAGFRPKFRQIARTLTNVDLVFVEEAMERWMLEYDRAFASIHTPSCIWRRTGEIQKANQEFSNLTGVPASMFRDGQLCVYELMDEDSAVRYWEGYAKIAFDPSQRSMSMSCTLHVPISLTRHRPRHLSATPASQPAKSAASAPPYIPDLALPQSIFSDGASSDAGGSGDEFREIKCCFSVTIRRDAWGVPVAIMGQWIPI